MSFVLRSEASTNRTDCGVVEDNIVKQGIQKFYCTAAKIYDKLETVSIQYNFIILSVLAIL